MVHEVKGMKEEQQKDGVTQYGQSKLWNRIPVTDDGNANMYILIYFMTL